MAEETWAYDGSNWRLVRDLWVRAGTSWNEVESGWVYTGSAWKQIFNYDTTGPSAPTSTSATWGTSGTTPYCYVYWVQPSDADFSYTRLERRREGEASWSFIANYSGNAGVALAYTDYDISLFPYTTHSAINQASAGHTYRVIPYDTRGNQGTIATIQSKGQGDTVYRGYIKTPYYRNPTGSATWSTNSPVGWLDGVSQGWQQPWTRRRFGHYFYDNTSTFWNLNVTSAGIQLKRFSGAGINTGIPAYLHTSSATALMVFAGLDPIGNIQNVASPQGSFVYEDNEIAPFPGNWANQIMTGFSSSVVLDEETTSPASGYTYSAAYSNWGDHTYDAFLGIVFSGTLIISHTG